MPFESLRKRLSTDLSSGVGGTSGGGSARRRDSQMQQQQQQHQQQHLQDYPQHSQRSTHHEQQQYHDQGQGPSGTGQDRGYGGQEPSSSRTPRHHRPVAPQGSFQDQVISPRTSRTLAPEVYQRIKEVDQEPSTLTASGVKGLSARVTDKQDYSQPLPDGTLQTYTCQTVELYKRPGQSLGLFLREGNNDDRFDGIFVSRVQEGSDLRKANVLHAGDEILTVNKVDVTQKNIDEVVIMISTPRRLLLRTRTMTSGDGAGGARMDDVESGKFIRPIDSLGGPIVVNKPIAIIKQQMPRDESRESTMTDDGAILASSQLMSTAQTSLGVRARQQESESSLSDANNPQQQYNRMGQPYGSSSAAATPMAHESRSRERNPLAQRSLSDRWSYGRQYPEGQELQDLNSGANANHPMSSSNPHPPTYQSTLARTAYLPPPRLQGHLPSMDRANIHSDDEASMTGPLAAAAAAAIDPYQQPMTPSVPWSPSTAQSSSEYADPMALFSPRSVASDSRLATSVQHQPRSVLRQPSAFPTAIFPSNKSNSLPRRQPTGQRITWRNDVMMGAGAAGGGVEAAAMMANPVSYYPVDESDGATSAPELAAMSPGYGFVPDPVYPLPQTPTSGKTIDDVFSRNQYQAWTRYPSTPMIDRFANPYYTSSPSSSSYGGVYPDQQQSPYMQMSSQSRPSSYTGQPVPYADYLAQSTSTLTGDDPGGPATAYWSQQRREHEPLYGSGPVHNRTTLNRGPPKIRSSSLPPRGILNQPPPMQPVFDYDQRIYENVQNLYDPQTGTMRRNAAADAGFYGLDVSPLPRRRLPLSLAAANPSFGYTADAGPFVEGPPEGHPASLTGLLYLRVIEGRQIRSRDPEEMYCVVEIDGEHRARTEVSDWHSAFHWNEMFEIDIFDNRRVDFYVYSWHPRYRHKLRHRGFLMLVDTLLSQSKYDEEELGWSTTQTSHSFALNLDPRGQLFIQIGFHAMAMAYRRQLATRRAAYWGVPLDILIDRETQFIVHQNGQVPTVLRRLVQEIERRGVDTTGLYVLCGSSSKKYLLRDQLERDASLADLSPDSVPDLNILTSVLKDFLRELPEPLVPSCTFQMLLDAWKVCVPNDREGNAKLMLGVVDCLAKTNKCTFMVLMDHLKYVISQSPHNGLSATKCGFVFGPLAFCTSQAYPLVTRLAANDLRFDQQPPAPPPKPYFSFLDHRLAARLMETLLELWPSPRSSSESSGSENSTMNLTGNGDTSLVDLWLQENRLPESTC